MKPFILSLLRISVCQIRYIEKTPESAAVNEAVNLAKQNGYKGLSGFVNGVLRNIVRQPEAPEIHGIAMEYSYPKWLAADLVKWLGNENAKSFCHQSHQPPPVTIFANTHKITVPDLANRLLSEGIEATPLGDEFLIISRTGDITQLPAFNEGLFFVMDPGAVWTVKALRLTPGQTVFDLCAAPGGKSFTAACYMGNQGQVKAFDLHPHRANLIRETARRLNLNCITTHIKDSLVHDKTLKAQADAVLLDAPCTGYGTIRKRPEIKYNRNPQDAKDLAVKQRQMLSIASKYVKPGGTLVYSTCTVAREENIDNVRWFLQNHSFKMRPIDLPNPEAIPYILEDDCLQILPSTYNDGFFIASFTCEP